MNGSTFLGRPWTLGPVALAALVVATPQSAPKPGGSAGADGGALSVRALWGGAAGARWLGAEVLGWWWAAVGGWGCLGSGC